MATKSKPKSKSPKSAGESAANKASYEAKKRYENRKSREEAEDTREIGPLPPIMDPERRESCRKDFSKFLKTYFPEDVRHPWSPVHLKVIKSIELVVLVGAMLAIGIPRGWAKTFLSVRGVIWAVAYRHHTMCMLIAASDSMAADLIQDIRDEFENNALLQSDFPEMCLPVASLEGINQRGKSQLLNGVRTRVKAASHEMHLGDVNGVDGAVIYAGGITGSKIRGRRKKRGDSVDRPTLGLIDDFQTRASASSKLQVDTRLNIVQGDIPGLPGADQSWACLLTCTVIRVDDAADQLLDRSRNPDWRGIRQAFLESLPDDDALEMWQEWNRIREEDLQKFDDDADKPSDESISERAHDYYRENHEAMNRGCVVAWEYAYDENHYVDALEKAMHWYFRDRLGFWSELQNQPDKFEVSSLPQLHAQNLLKRWHHLPRNEIPADCEHLTAHADVSKNVLWYEVRAWKPDSTSYTIDYGTWPEQTRAYYTQASARKTIDRHYKQLPTWDIRVMAAIRDLFQGLFQRQFTREDGAVLRLDLAGIDANDEKAAVIEGIRKSGLQGKLWPMHSRSFRPPKVGINDLAKRDGDVIGEHWRRRNPATGNMRYITYDTDKWKSHHRDRLIMPRESPGAIQWFAGTEHRMLADHHVSETSSMLFHEDRQMEIWLEKPNEDNHLFDVGCGNDVLGSVLGLKLPASQLLDFKEPKKRRRRRRSKVLL